MKPRPLLLVVAFFAILASASAQTPPPVAQPKPPPKTPEQQDQDRKMEAQKVIAKMPADATKLLDVTYVDNPQPGKQVESNQTLDLFVPPGPGPFPLLIWLHGGGWHSGGKEAFAANFALKFFPKGFAVAGVEYRDIRDFPFPAQIEDCEAAVVWLRKHAAQYHLNPDRFGVFGHSAGAHLSALIAVAGDSSQFSKDPVSARVQAAVCWATPADLDRDRGQWPQKTFIWDPKFSLLVFPGGLYTTELADAASPASYVHPGVPPMYIVHGAKDNLVPPGQVEGFVDKLKKAGVDVTFVLDPDHGHDVMGAPYPDQALAFFQRVLQPPAGSAK